MTDDRYHRAVYVISVAAELAGMHPQTLRIYERKGLLEPERTAGGRRRYSEADLALLERIAELTSDGINLAGVQRILELESQVADLSEQLSAALDGRLTDIVRSGWSSRGKPADVRSRSAVTLYRGPRTSVPRRNKSDSANHQSSHSGQSGTPKSDIPEPGNSSGIHTRQGQPDGD